MKRAIFILVVCLSAVLAAQAQELPGVCGTSAATQELNRPRLRENLASAATLQGIAADRNGAVRYVPIHFHLVGDANGDGRIRETLVLNQLCRLNEAYDTLNIQFYLSPHPTYGLFDKSISNNNVYNKQTNTGLMQARRHKNALNVFITELSDDGSPNPNGGVVLAYYDPSGDWVVDRKDQVTTSNKYTLPHEVGHFFSLNHTFYGYESNPFDPSDPTWPKAPVLAPNGGGMLTERVNGSNCTIAGDEICDTPADYNFGAINNQTCNLYAGGAQDPLGVSVDPMENNYMGYFFNCSDYQFTPQQIGAIQSDLNKANRNYLDNTFVPKSTSINTPNDLLIAPVGTGSNLTQFYDQVLLQWKSMPEASYYLVEVDITAAYASPSAQLFIQSDTTRLLTNLLPNKKYFWRIRPFNEYVTCASSRQSSFTTSQTSGVPSLEALAGWQIAPNPLHEGQSVRLTLAATAQFEANVRILDAAGRQVYMQSSLRFPEGETTVDLPAGDLPNGLYFIALENNSGRSVRKWSILR